MSGAIIPDLFTAKRVAAREVDIRPGARTTIFQYQQPRTGLTLYGVAVTEPGKPEREVRFQ